MANPRFSSRTLAFLQKAGRQKNPNWLERNREEYVSVLLGPLQHLAQSLKAAIGPLAPGYHFPVKGIGRLRRPSNRVGEGRGLYKNWMAYSASRPTGSRFDHNPNLFFLLNPEDRDDSVLVAGGLYLPSSRQTRAVREAIAADASPFESLFASKAFSRRFKGGFAREKVASRPPRGFDPAHPRMDWLKLQAFYVWRRYSLREFSSPRFPETVAEDWKQIVRLNDLLERATAGRWARARRAEPARLLERLDEYAPANQKMDF